ncbi:hypothetical protein [Vibrio gallaecicus]|uniref:DUF4760 domain-containing protein n=1 Tax=Vibrio gallaecicus TaxID=552386 RepID=A0ABV4N8S3_9VIBR
MDFFNSEFFTSLITLGVGLIAWAVFRAQQKQTDRDSATLVYLQIRDAERRINDLKQQPQQELVVSSLTKQIIGENNWDKFKGRLVKYFDADEIELINNFYSRVISAESARAECKAVFDESLNEKARQIQSKLIDNIYQNIDDKTEIARKRELLINYASQEVFVFDPDAPKNKAFKELIHITYVSPTPTGEKLKKLAKVRQ